MNILIKKHSVPANTVGFLYKRNALERELKPGMHFEIDPLGLTELYIVPTGERWTMVESQEVLASDNVAFRFSYTVCFQITDPKAFMSSYPFDEEYTTPIFYAQHLTHLHSQVVLRERLSGIKSNEINAARATALEGCEPAMEERLSPSGIAIRGVLLRDVSFPKRIQELFAVELESQIRAKADLENARTTVAAARALKNAGEIIKGDTHALFLQYLETISKIASTGRHTFVVGDGRVVPGQKTE